MSFSGTKDPLNRYRTQCRLLEFHLKVWSTVPSCGLALAYAIQLECPFYLATYIIHESHSLISVYPASKANLSSYVRFSKDFILWLDPVNGVDGVWVLHILMLFEDLVLISMKKHPMELVPEIQQQVSDLTLQVITVHTIGAWWTRFLDYIFYSLSSIGHHFPASDNHSLLQWSTRPGATVHIVFLILGLGVQCLCICLPKWFLRPAVCYCTLHSLNCKRLLLLPLFHLCRKLDWKLWRYFKHQMSTFELCVLLFVVFPIPMKLWVCGDPRS